MKTTNLNLNNLDSKLHILQKITEKYYIPGKRVLYSKYIPNIFYEFSKHIDIELTSLVENLKKCIKVKYILLDDFLELVRTWVRNNNTNDQLENISNPLINDLQKSIENFEEIICVNKANNKDSLLQKET